MSKKKQQQWTNGSVAIGLADDTVKVNYTEFREMLKAPVVTIHHLSKFFKRSDLDFDEHGNVFVGFNEDAQGLPILVAHTDNVLNGEREPVFDLNRRCIMGRNVGIGFDDKAGIMAIISLWQHFKEQRFRAIFPADEEVGGLGSQAMDPTWYTDAAWILELDRKGNKDLIQVSGGTRLCSDEFASKWEALGFEKADGVYTDVNEFKPNADWINMANLSIGYYNPHTNTEYLDTVDFEKIVNRVKDFIKADLKFEDDKPDPVKDYSKDYGGGYSSGGWYTGNRCDNCGSLIPSGTMIYDQYGCKFCCKECMHDYQDDEWAKPYKQ